MMPISSQTLQNYIAKKITYLEKPQVVDLTCLNDGWESDVYAFNLVFTDKGSKCIRRLILRAYTGQEVPFLPSKPVHEFNLLRQLYADGYPVPDVYLLECDKCYLGSPFIIMEYIEGQGFDTRYYGAKPAEQAVLLKETASLFAALHALDIKSYCENPQSDSIQQEISRLYELAVLFEADYAQQALNWLRNKSLAIGAQKLALVHWDFHFKNIMLCSNGQPVVIDWTVSDVTDYRFDLAWSLLFLGDDSDRFVSFYEEESGQRVQDLDFFMAFAYLRRLLSMLISLEHGAEALGMRPGAESIIRKHKGHLKGVYAKWAELTQLYIPKIESVIERL